MSDVGHSNSFRWGRGCLAALLAAALGFAAVEFLSPEQHVGSGTVAAEVSVRVVPKLAPSADAIRRSMLTNDHLREVAARLRDGNGTDSAAKKADDAATFERWRRQLIVDILPTQSPERRRIRFSALAGGRPAEAAALAETIAVLYAESLTSERWYASIDRLRSAESAADATFDRLLDSLRNNTTARTAPRDSGKSLAKSGAAARAIPVRLPAAEAAPLAATQTELDRELHRLIRQRSELLETLQPAHPQIVALDARLNALQVAGAATHVRRLSNEVEVDLTLPDFEEVPAAPSPSAPTHTVPQTVQVDVHAASGLPPATAEAVRQWQQSRVAVKESLDELLAPAAAEFPVVSTAVAGLQLWEHRAFWRIAAGSLGLILGIAFALPRRGRTAFESAPTPRVSPSPVVPPREEPIAAPPPHPPVSKAAEPRHEQIAAVANFASPSAAAIIETVEQAATATGGPVLGVLVRRRESTSPVA